MGSLGGFEWLIIILVVLLLFGAKRIPELARGLGQGINEFRKASDEIKKEIDQGAKGGGGSNFNSEESSRPRAKAESEPETPPREETKSGEEDEQPTESTNKENKS
jgi:sec-independent protein translocase protein TatA